MRCKGISYDTGFVRGGEISRTRFEPGEVRRELAVLRDELHCTAVRVIGGDPGRMEFAAAYAAELGLEVWFSPYPLELDGAQMLELFADCAERAEQLRRGGAEVVFVAGAEIGLMARGFLPGEGTDERLAFLLDRRERVREVAAGLSVQVNEFLGAAVRVVRERFGGRVTYASIPLERVDWGLFDIVGVDLYRSAEVAGQFAAGVRSLVAQGKPVAITEFGSAAYRGAGERGARCMEIVEYDSDTGAPMRLDGEYVRDEPGQAGYVRELLEVFDEAGVDSAFVFMFALENFPYRPDGDPRDDLDLASPGIVRVLEDGGWEPKEAFRGLADYYSGS